MSALNVNDISYEEKQLFVPSLNEVKTVLESALLNNFEDVTVEVVECPNLSKSPYDLVDCGLGGSPLLLEVGGPPFLLPLVQRSKVYDLKSLIRKCYPAANSSILAIGAGAGPFPIRGTNCEGIYNMKVAANGDVTNSSYTAKVHGPNEECVLEKVPPTETRSALLLNLFLSQGLPGKVLKVVCRKRKGNENFVECMRLGLAKNYGEKCVGMGGIFLIKKGHVHQHVMRDFSKTPIHTDEDVNNWLKFYNMPAQLNAVGTLVTHENDLDLRLQHFHSFSSSNWGGHYHYDTTPDVVEYEGYFNIAEKIVRMDKPTVTHKVGRD
ncbi:ester hydrolase C11orf54 homolog [Eupeodes corollae]|uniref:ester hydrolase C11orf54 homolog n=1 Tax=Eupeodes corollae TaxID=290404 RepID=UPI00248FA400|nr:ester hydrolase C11orf54 homolog [Eupeodes corollae]